MAALKINTTQFQSYLNGETPILVEYMAPWCMYCRRIGPALDHIAQQMEGSLIVAKIDIDEEAALAEQEQIEVVPTLVLYRSGKALGSIVAPDSKAKVDTFIRETLV